MPPLRILVLPAALLACQAARAECAWSVRALLGAPINAPMPLAIRQSGEPDVRVTARYASRPFALPLYLGLEIARRAGDGDWSLEYLHQKLYLENPPPEVQDFAVSHGYNLFAVSRGWRLGRGLFGRLGAGPVVAHPESTVRGRRFSGRGVLGSGFYLSGATGSATVEKRFPLLARLHASLEAKVTAAYAVVPVDGGSASVPSVSLHALAGIGWGAAD